MSIQGNARYIEDKNIIQGWFFDTATPSKTLIAEIYINSRFISEITLDVMRDDIVKQGIHPTGKVGFQVHHYVSENDDIVIRFKNTDYVYHIKHDSDSTFQINSNIKKRKLCIVHIGMHKTGSSSIQHNLYTKKFSNFSYFDLGTENHSIPIYSYYAENPYHYHIHKRADRTKKDIDEYNKKFVEKFENHLKNHKDVETFVLSGEDICVLSPQSLQKLKKFLLKYFHQIKIVGYVREPISYMTSEFQERVKIGLHTFNINNLYSSYKNKFEKFDHIFGKENIKLLLFDPKNLYNDDVTSDFLFKMQLIDNNDDSTSFQRTNESLSMEATAILYLFNKYKYEYNALELRSTNYKNFQQYLLPTMQKVGKSKLRFSNELMHSVIRQNIDDIKWIESRLNVKFHHSVSSNAMIKTEKDLLQKGIESLKSLDQNLYQEINTIINLDLFMKLVLNNQKDIFKVENTDE